MVFMLSDVSASSEFWSAFYSLLFSTAGLRRNHNIILSSMFTIKSRWKRPIIDVRIVISVLSQVLSCLPRSWGRILNFWAPFSFLRWFFAKVICQDWMHIFWPGGVEYWLSCCETDSSYYRNGWVVRKAFLFRPLKLARSSYLTCNVDTDLFGFRLVRGSFGTLVDPGFTSNPLHGIAILWTSYMVQSQFFWE